MGAMACKPDAKVSDRLLDLPVLLVDCQTTANSPQKGHLLEVGWLPCRAAEAVSPDEADVRSTLVRTAQDVELPFRVRRLTGIQPDDLHAAEPERMVWQRLSHAARMVALQARLPRCPTVIHFARFERPFLKALHETYGPGGDFPFDMICTHAISRRLFAELPRRGLRALAGFLGYSVPSVRRCDGHVRATAAIWYHLVQRLAREEEVLSLEDLQRWMEKRSAARRVPRRYPMPQHQRDDAPDAPGVYRFLRSNGDLLYIGKARSLRARLNSYFQPSRRHSERVLEMLTQAARIEVSVTGTALEAALMESEHIKACVPPYNVALTEAARTTTFVSKDFGSRSDRPESACPLGPFVSKDLVDIVHSIGRALRGDGNLKDLSADRFCPEETILARGIDLFRQKHGGLIARLGLWRALLRVGHDSWRERLTRDEEQRPPMDGKALSAAEVSVDDPAPVDWSPELVCRRIEGLLRHAGHQMRRARWLTLLTDAVVVWRAGANADGTHALVLDGGLVAECRRLDPAASLPASSGFGRQWRIKQSRLDLQAYDRLRVLTTELRRLRAEERLMCVRLGRGVDLKVGQLDRLLRWV